MGLTFSKASNELVAVKLLAAAEIPHWIKLFNLLRLLVHSAGFTCPYSQVVFFKFIKESESSDSDTPHFDFCKQTHRGFKRFPDWCWMRFDAYQISPRPTARRPFQLSTPSPDHVEAG